MSSQSCWLAAHMMSPHMPARGRSSTGTAILRGCTAGAADATGLAQPGDVLHISCNVTHRVTWKLLCSQQPMESLLPRMHLHGWGTLIQIPDEEAQLSIHVTIQTQQGLILSLTQPRSRCQTFQKPQQTGCTCQSVAARQKRSKHCAPLFQTALMRMKTFH